MPLLATPAYWAMLLASLQALAPSVGCSNATSPRGHLHVEFVQYAVPDSRLANGRYCDSVILWDKRLSACDPQVNLCIGEGDPNKCTVGRIALPWISNSDVVNFGTRIGSIANPVALPFDSLSPTLSLGATIYDHDRVGSAEVIDTLAGSVEASQVKKTVQINGRTFLRIRVWFSCADNYYGHVCRVFNYCRALNPCAHGRCVNQPGGGFRCRCQAGWTGDKCDAEVAESGGENPCAGQTATKFHECRMRYRRGRPQMYAIEYYSEPVADSETGGCVQRRGRRIVTGPEVGTMCRG